MKSLTFILSATLLAASMSLAANDNYGTRQRAKSAYDELDGGSNSGNNGGYSSSNNRSKNASNDNQYQSNDRYAKYNNRYAPKEDRKSQISTRMDDLPKPVIMVLPATNNKGATSLQVVTGNPYARATMDGVNEYLTKQLYEVKALEGTADVDNVIQLQNDIAGTDEDLAYLASLSLNADVYIKFSGTVDGQYAVVELNAYESSTARLLGTQSGTMVNNGRKNQADMQAALRSAAKKAMSALENKILSYWQSDLKKGNQYKVIMNIKGEFSDDEIEDLQEDIKSSLKEKFNSVKINAMTSKTIDMVLWADPSKVSDASDVYSVIRKSVKALASTKKINVFKKLVIMDIQ